MSDENGTNGVTQHGQPSEVSVIEIVQQADGKMGARILKQPTRAMLDTVLSVAEDLRYILIKENLEQEAEQKRVQLSRAASNADLQRALRGAKLS